MCSYIRNRKNKRNKIRSKLKEYIKQSKTIRTCQNFTSDAFLLLVYIPVVGPAFCDDVNVIQGFIPTVDEI